MPLYTVVAQYAATGEGQTWCIWMGIADNPVQALETFASSLQHGDFWAQGAEVIEGFAFDHPVAQMLMPPQVREMMETPNGYREWSSLLHLNYS